MQAGFCFAAELAHDDRLLVENIPNRVIGVCSSMLIPADIFVGSENVQHCTKWIIYCFRVPVRAH